MNTNVSLTKVASLPRPAAFPHKLNLVRIITSSELSVLSYWMIGPVANLALAERGYSDSLIGFFAASTWVLTLITNLFSAPIVRRLGTRGAYLTGAWLMLGGAMCFAFSHALPFWFLGNVLVGIGGGIRWVTANQWMAEQTPTHLRGRITALSETLTGLTMIVAPALLPFINMRSSTPFFIVLSLQIISLGAAWGANDVAQHPDDDHRSVGLFEGWKQMLHFGVVVIAAAMLGGFFECGSIPLLQLLGLRMGFSPENATALVTVIGVGSFAFQFPMGWLADKYNRLVVMLSCAGLVFLGVILLPFAHMHSWAIWWVAFVWGGAGGGLFTLSLIHVSVTFKRQLMVTGLAAVTMSYTLGTVVAPALGGLALDSFSMRGLFALCVVVAALGLFYIGRENLRHSKRPQPNLV